MDIQGFESLLLYYGRSEFFHTMQKTVLDGLARYPNHFAFRLYNGIALVLGNKVQEGIRELNPLKNDEELGVAAVLALIYAHNRCNVVDVEAIENLEQRLLEEGTHANACYYAAVFTFLTKNFSKALEYIDKTLRFSKEHESAIVLRSWIDMFQYNANVSGNVLHALERIIANSKSIDANLALVYYFQLKGQFDSATSNLIKLSTRYPQINIPLIIKMEMQLAALDWERSYETALRIINLDPTNIAALRIKAYILIVREGNIKGGISTLQQLLVATERVESGNSKLLFEICQLFARISSRNQEILALTLRFIDKLVQTNPKYVESIVESGYQHMLLGNINEAATCYRSATKIENNNFNALCGLIFCQLLKMGSTNQISQQIEFLKDLKPGDEDPFLLLIRAKTSSGSDDAMAFLNKAMERHMFKLENVLYGWEYFLKLDPEFLIQITTELLRHTPSQVHINNSTRIMQETIHISLKHCISILDVILKVCPSHLHANYMRAKVHFLCAEVTFAYNMLHHIINEIDPSYTDAYLLLAQIQMQNHKYAKALQYLEMALSINFSIREDPKYYLLLGIGQRQQQQHSEAQKSFISAMHLLGKDIGASENTISNKNRAHNLLVNDFTVSDKVTLYLELINTYKEIGDVQSVYESERLLQLAMEEFNNTTEEGRLVIAHAELILKSSNVKKAIELLSSIQPNQSYFIQAKTLLANIFLHNQKDRVAFAVCFKQLVETCPEPENYVLLGEAYMSIQEPDLAIEAYEKAYKINSKDSSLANKLGRAFIKTHQYGKAIVFYKNASKEHSGLNLNLAELYLKLRQYDDAEAILEEQSETPNMELWDIDGLQLKTKTLLLLARVHEKAGNNDRALVTLTKAKENQYIIHRRSTIHQASKVKESVKMLSKICLLVAQHCTKMRNTEQALIHFKECLKYDPSDIDVLISLSRIYMQMNSMDLCRDVCTQILQIDSNNEAASIMMADLSFRKMDFENAAYHFSQLLLTQPSYWTALARLIEVMRRSGTLSDVYLFLQRAEQTISNPDLSPGLNYCTGLYEWYNGNPNGALRNFNAARRDGEWGPQAIFNMIEICINPDGDIPNGTELFEYDDNGELSDARLIALRTADRLLKELRPRPGVINNEAINHRMLKNFLKLASKQKFQIDSALQDFIELTNREDLQGNAGPILGMATALIQLKQVQRAKNSLKRLTRASWNFEEAEYLERSWLLLADIYINSNKLDVAEALVAKVLEHNKSCAKAYELAGCISEKSQLYRDAAKNYRKAWCYGKSKPYIGYKLAYIYMKKKQYAEAIEICQQVLKLHPDYNIIRKDILDKCRSNIRL
ncbi:tetratricopeptide repeat protein 21B-like [Haematobia irritans]|uniref:tetratricopeptide repeat protein 21B-like n=1 Tax=Haematobia irritans TaxID=7368 RepID=UPI003F501EFA